MVVRAAIVAVVAYFAGCATAASLTPRVRTYHDDERDVTCWLVPQIGVACVPDRLIYGPEPDFAAKGVVLARR